MILLLVFSRYCFRRAVDKMDADMDNNKDRPIFSLLVGLTAGKLADKIRVDFEIFKNSLQVKLFEFLHRLILVQFYAYI